MGTLSGRAVTEARKQAEADRAALEAQADELVTAVLAVGMAGEMHDRLLGGWRDKLGVALRAAVQGSTAYGRSGQRGFPAVIAAYGDAAGVIAQWDRDSGMSAAGLAAPLNRLAATVTPLLRRQEPGLAAAAEELFTAITKDYADIDRAERAFVAFHQALQRALEPPTVNRPRRALHRGQGGGPQSG